MKQSQYTWMFVAVAFVLTTVAMGSYLEISANSMAFSAAAALDTSGWATDAAAMAAPARATPIFAELYTADSGWRQANARPYTLAELRARGDGRRSPRQAMQDRVFAAARAGNRGAAIAELQRWTRANPRDADALLWLARVLNEAGRSRESVSAYRRALAIAGGEGR